MLGFLVEVGSDPAQIPNNSSYKTGVGVENLDATYSIDVCDDPGFPQQFVYTLDPGQWYSYSGTNPFWARITPGQANPSGYNVTCWVNPGGAANIGGNHTTPGAIAVDVIQPNPLPVSIITPNTQVNVAPSQNPWPAGQDWNFPLPTAGRVVLFQASFATDGTLQARYPYYQVTIAGLQYRFLMSPIVIHRQQTWIFTGGPGLSKPYTRTGDQVVTFAFPDVYLPPGTNIGSYTGNLQAGDQWYNIAMCMATE